MNKTIIINEYRSAVLKINIPDNQVIAHGNVTSLLLGKIEKLEKLYLDIPEEIFLELEGKGYKSSYFLNQAFITFTDKISLFIRPIELSKICYINHVWCYQPLDFGVCLKPTIPIPYGL